MNDDERHNKRMDYETEIYEAALRLGLDPDVAASRACDDYYNGLSVIESVARYAAEVRRRRERQRDQEPEEEEPTP